jgi:hypothetical protein
MLIIIAALLATAYALPTAEITTNISKPENAFAASSWMTAATYSLLSYDMGIVVVFVWCWVCGVFWWMKRERGMGVGWHGGEMGRVERRKVELEGEMRRVGMF